MLFNIVALSRQLYIFRKRHIYDALRVVLESKEISQKKDIAI